MIINLRGTSGAGKTTVVRELMERHGYSEIVQKKKTIGIHIPIPDEPLYVVGRYDNVCGGCDTVKSQDEVRRRIRTFARSGHVLFEGLTINNGYTKNLALMRKLGHPFSFVFLDTPLRTCISRVRKRRKARGADPDFNTSNTQKLFDANLRYLMRAVHEGANPRVISHKNPTAEFMDILLEHPL